jgi:hypothetical protein
MALTTINIKVSLANVDFNCMKSKQEVKNTRKELDYLIMHATREIDQAYTCIEVL